MRFIDVVNAAVAIAFTSNTPPDPPIITGCP